MTTTTTATQAIIATAYERYEDNLSWTWGMFIDQCQPTERYVVLIAALDSQVNNGGFTQWCDNGYVTESAATIRALNWLGGEAADRAAELVQIATAEWMNYRANYRPSLREDVEYPDLNHLDTEYYAGWGDQILAALETKVQA